METLHNLIQLWPRVKLLLLPFEGMASQVYVLEVPRSELERAITVFCQRAKSASIKTLNGYAFGEDEVRDCDVINRADVLNAASQSIIVGAFQGNRTIQFWIWPNSQGATFDAEFVFFGDEFFGGNANDESLMSSFGTVYSLAEAVRENDPKCECVLSASETGDPRQHREEDWTVFW